MDVLRTGKKLGRLMAYVGLVCGVLYSFGGFVYDLLTVGLNPGTAMAFGALLGMPIIFGCFGLLAGSLVAVVSNAFFHPPTES